jgi:two-component system LytT family response regulator
VKAVIVDDERLARARLRKLLEPHADVAVVAEADSVATARAAIEAHRPDVVFLDITMPGSSGFDLLDQMIVDATVVFVTAHDDQAIRAFEVGAVDYLLKPIDPARLATTLDRIRPRTQPQRASQISITVDKAVRVVPLADIVVVRADGDYSELVLRDGTAITQKQSLAAWEQRLGAAFMRVHRNTLVSLADVERVERADDTSAYRLYLRGHAEPIAVSRSHGAALKAALRGE